MGQAVKDGSGVSPLATSVFIISDLGRESETLEGPCESFWALILVLNSLLHI